jgi:hypothetical protein
MSGHSSLLNKKGFAVPRAHNMCSEGPSQAHSKTWHKTQLNKRSPQAMAHNMKNPRCQPSIYDQNRDAPSIPSERRSVGKLLRREIAPSGRRSVGKLLCRSSLVSARQPRRRRQHKREGGFRMIRMKGLSGRCREDPVIVRLGLRLQLVDRRWLFPRPFSERRQRAPVWISGRPLDFSH